MVRSCLYLLHCNLALPSFTQFGFYPTTSRCSPREKHSRLSRYILPAADLERWASQKASHTTNDAVGALLCRLFTEESHMATNLALDQELLDRAFRVSGEPTKKAAVTRALQEFIARREQRRVAELFGKLEWDASFDYKAERARNR